MTIEDNLNKFHFLKELLDIGCTYCLFKQLVCLSKV